MVDGAKILRETWTDDEEHTLVPLYDNEDSVCGIVYNEVPYYFQKNLQGDVIGITDENGTVVAEYVYDAWGKVIDISGCDACIAEINPFRYRSYYFDKEIELYYLQSRYYDPEIGRFLNADMAEFAAFGRTALVHNLFGYCENDCVNAIDDNGYKKKKMSVVQTLVFGIIGLVVNLIKYGTNIFRIFKYSSAATIQKVILSIVFLLPTSLACELVKYHVRHLASLIVTYSKSLLVELAMLGLNAGKLSIAGLAISAVCRVALLYLPTLFDSISMILYGIKKKSYFWDKKWYGIKYYSK